MSENPIRSDPIVLFQIKVNQEDKTIFKAFKLEKKILKLILFELKIKYKNNKMTFFHTLSFSLSYDVNLEELSTTLFL